MKKLSNKLVDDPSNKSIESSIVISFYNLKFLNIIDKNTNFFTQIIFLMSSSVFSLSLFPLPLFSYFFSLILLSSLKSSSDI